MRRFRTRILEFIGGKMFVSVLYFILFLLSLGAIYLLIQKVSNKRSSYYVVLFTLIAVVCLAYFSYSISMDSGMALVSNQFSYIDGTFVQMFFLFCVLDICGIEIKKVFAIPLVLGNLFFLIVAFTTEYSKLLYESYKIGYYKGSAHLEMEFGPLENVFLLWVVINTLIPIGIIIYAVLKKKKISYLYTGGLGILELCIVSLYFIEETLDLGFDILPCGYVIMEYIILAIIGRIALYDGSQIVVYNSEDRKEYGYIIFDKKKNYVGSNKVARFFFDELNELRIDRPVDDGFIKREFVDKLDNAISGDEAAKVYTRRGRELLCTIKPYSQRNIDRIYGYIVEVRDDTDQQQLIKKLNEMNGELEAAVNSANSANRAKSDFLANMSHEIRTPINAVLGMNEIALRECKDEAITAYLSDIRNAGNNLLFLINDILDFSKIEAGKIDIFESPYKIMKLIKDVHDLIEVKAREKGLELIVNVDQNIPSVLNGDENRIRQIMINILNNAIKYTERGKVELSISSEPIDDSSAKLIIVVSDTGIGIKEEDLPVLFDSFQRVDEAKNAGIEGTGLGLAITKRLIGMMKGRVDVSSVYGEGSTFTVSIPQEIVDDSPAGEYKRESSVNNTAIAAVEHVDASNLDVLVVDDTKLNLTVVKGLLKVTNARIDTCMSGMECLKMIRDKHYDVILLDHMMPEMDGIETLHKARELKDSKCEDSMYIALTANAISGVKEMYLSEGFDGYLSKPIDSKQLESILASATKG